MREVNDLDDRAGIIVDEKGTATARTARRRRDNLKFSFFSFDVCKSSKLLGIIKPYMIGEEEICLPNETEIRTR